MGKKIAALALVFASAVLLAACEGNLAGFTQVGFERPFCDNPVDMQAEGLLGFWFVEAGNPNYGLLRGQRIFRSKKAEQLHGPHTYGLAPFDQDVSGSLETLSTFGSDPLPGVPETAYVQFCRNSKSDGYLFIRDAYDGWHYGWGALHVGVKTEGPLTRMTGKAGFRPTNLIDTDPKIFAIFKKTFPLLDLKSIDGNSFLVLGKDLDELKKIVMDFLNFKPLEDFFDNAAHPVTCKGVVGEADRVYQKHFHQNYFWPNGTPKCSS